MKAETGVEVGDASAVRSKDFERVWMVAVELTGPGMGDGEAAVFATNRGLKEDGSGLIFAADGMAGQFSDYGDGGGRFSAADDGVSEAKDCLT